VAKMDVLSSVRMHREGQSMQILAPGGMRWPQPPASARKTLEISQRSGWKRRAAVVVASVPLAVLSVVAFTQGSARASTVTDHNMMVSENANATSSGIVPWQESGTTTFGKFCFRGTCLPNGAFTVTYLSLDRSGHFPDQLRGAFATAFQLCTWWIDFDAYSTNGSRTMHLQGAAQPCSRSSGRVWQIPILPSSYLPTGSMCASLYSSGASAGPVRVARACVPIQP
jgi:hypothetical protein